MKREYLGIIFSKHAIDRLCNRQISQADAVRVIRSPDRIADGSTAGSKKFFKDIGGKQIRVVAKKNEKEEWVVLSCWARETKGRTLPGSKPSFWASLLRRFF